MKATVDLPNELLTRARKRAAETRARLRDILERGLRRARAGAASDRESG
jgi:hypothetical protein